MNYVEIKSINSTPDQELKIKLPGANVTMRLRFHSVAEIWTVDVSRNGKQANGISLNVGGSHTASAMMNFDILVFDNSGMGIDPFKLDDFESGRCSLVIAYA